MDDSYFFLFLTEVANQLGIDNLDAVTIEDMAMEVKKIYCARFSGIEPSGIVLILFFFFFGYYLQVLKEIEKLTRVKKMMEEAAKPF